MKQHTAFEAVEAEAGRVRAVWIESHPLVTVLTPVQRESREVDSAIESAYVNQAAWTERSQKDS